MESTPNNTVMTPEIVDVASKDKRDILEKCVREIRDNQKGFIKVAIALKQIADESLWKADSEINASNFKEYVNLKFNFSASYASQLRGAAVAYEQLKKANKLPENATINLCYEIYKNATRTKAGKDCVGYVDNLPEVTFTAMRKQISKPEKNYDKVSEIMKKIDSLHLSNEEMENLRMQLNRH